MKKKTKTFIGTGETVLSAVQKATRKMDRWLLKNDIVISPTTALLKKPGEPYIYVIMVVYNND